jgi:hypothetical protein
LIRNEHRHGLECDRLVPGCHRRPTASRTRRSRSPASAGAVFSLASGALLHFIDLLVPAFLAFIDDRVIPATHRRSDRLDCHDRGWIAVGTILKPYGLRPVRQLGCRNFTHDQRLVLMQEPRSLSMSNYRKHLMGCPSFDLHQNQNRTLGVGSRLESATSAKCRFCCKSQLRPGAKRDSVVLKRFSTRSIHDGASEE